MHLHQMFKMCTCPIKSQIDLQLAKVTSLLGKFSPHIRQKICTQSHPACLVNRPQSPGCTPSCCLNGQLGRGDLRTLVVTLSQWGVRSRGHLGLEMRAQHCHWYEEGAAASCHFVWSCGEREKEREREVNMKHKYSLVASALTYPSSQSFFCTGLRQWRPQWWPQW